MNCKLHIKQLLNIHPSWKHSYLDLYKIAYDMPNKAQYLERMAAAMAAELDSLAENGTAKEMGGYIDLSAVGELLIGPLSLCASSGDCLWPAEAKAILNNWCQYRKDCDESPMHIAKESAKVTVNIPPLRPGDWVMVTDADSVTEMKCDAAQQSLMEYDPAVGTKEPYPSHAGQYRKYHGSVAWLFNPWTGNQRNPFDIGSDVTGLLIKEPTND